MAVFGVPDCTRTTRCGRCARRRRCSDALADLNDELRARATASALAIRIGVNTGEVVAGDGATRAELRDRRRRQRRGAPRAGGRAGRDPDRRRDVPARPRRGRGRAGRAARRSRARREPVPRLPPARGRRRARAGVARRLDSPMVGRERELGLLAALRARRRATRVPALHGARRRRASASRGSSHEFLARSADEATVLSGRCLPYGEGITFWPLVEIVAGRRHR